MPLAIEDYALIGDCHTGALVGTDGSIDWLCLPRFDSASTFGALLGDEHHGRWLLAPADPEARMLGRAYVEGTFTLVTRWATATGEVEVVDLMPHGDRRADVVRRVRGVAGTVRMRQELRIRFDYAAAMPWVRQVGAAERSGGGVTGGLTDSDGRRTADSSTASTAYSTADGDGRRTADSTADSSTASTAYSRPGSTVGDAVERAAEQAIIAAAGPDSVIVRGPRMRATDHRHEAVFDVAAGEHVDTVLTWYPAHREPPAPIDVDEQLAATNAWWSGWAEGCDAPGRYEAIVQRSLLVLRALTHEDTGGIVAAATTSLPEDFGGGRNWDYRYVWLRDASLTLQSLMLHGFKDEADHWRGWLLRAIAGDPADVQIMYGLSGERRLAERELDSLPGYRGSSPVRIGNGAYTQYQGDIFGEVMIALDEARGLGVAESPDSWSLQVALLGDIEQHWDREDRGIWEIRGPEQHFTHSRAMIWAALDRGIRAVREFGLEGPVERWEALRDRVRDEIEQRGWNASLGSYTQVYGGTEVDASLLQLAQIGYVDWADERMRGTVAAIERDLLRDGLLLRYRTQAGVDGLSGDEHPFLACSFWLAEQYAHSGRLDEAVELMDRLVGFANDVGLLAEEIDPATGRHAGNTPQAFSHLALVRAADAIHAAEAGGASAA